jgi:GntR family transcriptional regulator
MSPAPESKQDRRPPYQHAADELRRDILKGRIKPGEQMPSIRELQERFGARRGLDLHDPRAGQLRG